MKQTFWDKNKVFILGLIASLAAVLQPLLTQAPEDVTYKVLGYALASGILAYLAKEWRGQGLSILGIVGNLAGVVATLMSTGNISIPQLITQFLIALAMAAGADPKSRGYENSSTIVEAKKEGEAIVSAKLTTKP